MLVCIQIKNFCRRLVSYHAVPDHQPDDQGEEEQKRNHQDFDHDDGPIPASPWALFILGFLGITREWLSPCSIHAPLSRHPIDYLLLSEFAMLIISSLIPIAREFS